MKLNFLGKGSAFYPPYGNTCAYYIYEKELYLIDCGESVFGRLYEKNILDEVERVYVLVTHLHADHVGSLGSLISFFYCLRNIRVTVIHPETTVAELLTLEGIDPDGYVCLSALPENSAGMDAEAVEVKHAADMKCYGYILRDGQSCIYYSGDSADIPVKVQELFWKGEIERIYQDTSTHDSKSESHCYYRRLEDMFPLDERKRVFCMHLDSACEGFLCEKGFRIAGISERKTE